MNTESNQTPTTPPGRRDRWQRLRWAEFKILIYALLIVTALVVFALRPTLLQAIVKALNEKQLLFVLATGVMSGIIVSIIFAIFQTALWKRDIINLTASSDRMKDELAALRRDYVTHLNELVVAIGGPFTKSLFAYPPLTSDTIAEIISKESDRLYQQHHQRVLVKNGKDTYLIDGLKSYGDSGTLVWSLRFQTTWTWYNDSKVAKRPLDDLAFVTAANDESFGSFAGPIGSSAERESQRKRRDEFYDSRRNIVLATVANPADISKRLNDNELRTVFNIDRITVTCGDEKPVSYDGASLPLIPGDPIHGIYSAQVLPPSLELKSIGPDEEMRIDYYGHMYRLAEEDDDGYVGWISFTPTDIVAGKYELVLLHPSVVELEHQRFQIVVDAESSGVKHIHEPLDNKPEIHKQTHADDIPAEFASFRGPSAKIVGPTPLTSLDSFTVLWRGVRKGPAPVKPHEAAIVSALRH